MKSRALFESMLILTLVGGGYYLIIYVPKHAKAGEPVLALVNYFLTYSPVQSVNQRAYVIPDSLEVWDTPAEIRNLVAVLKSGEQVHVLRHFRDWARVRMLDGHDGWVTEDGLMNAETHAREEHLLRAVSGLAAQAEGHSADVDNLHIEPSRTAAVVAHVTPNRGLEIFGRRMVQRSIENGTPNILPASSSHLEAWYLVQAGSHAGWILGHRVQLDVPRSISAYAQDTNLVAWLALDTAEDNGHQIPQYLVADRVGIETCDFTDIRVLTWWKRKHTYAIAYKEGGLQGYFPILVTHEGSVPRFRLFLEDEGRKYQKTYGLFDTITRVLGTADTWDYDAGTASLASTKTNSRTHEAYRWLKTAIQK